MPMYTFEDTKSGKKLDVLRTVDDRDREPDENDDGYAELKLNKPPKWRRLVGEGIRTVRGASWGGKGYW